MKILVTGSNGMLGSDLSEILCQKHEVFTLTKDNLDITDREKTIKTVKSANTDILINCAAYTMVDQAEKEKELAFTINGIGVQNVALACEESRIPLCHISTDYVFDGRKSTPYTPFDNTNPINAYGESKLAGEKYIQWISSKFYIVRSSWLYGKSRNNFVRTIQKLCKEKDELKIVADQIGSPTWTVTLSGGISRLIETGAFGVYNITDDAGEGISWFEFAKEIVAASGSKAKVSPISTEDYPTLAKRPRYSVLDISLNKKMFGFAAGRWSEALREFLK